MTNKINFCWWCGRKLQRGRFAIIIKDGYKHICHKQCAKNIKEGKENFCMLRDDQLLNDGMTDE